MSKNRPTGLNKVKKSSSNPNDSTQKFPIVGIGASAGGLEALTSFFSNQPSNSGMAFVVIQHLDPTKKGMLPELLQRTTKIKVTQAKNNARVKPNTVYVIPPNKSISILNGMLHVSASIQVKGLRLPIDHFFHSLAKDQGENSVGIILSGMGSDGSSGLKAIKKAGGLTLVQEPVTAKFDSMPKNGINQANPDVIAKAGELPAKLSDLMTRDPFQITSNELDEQSSNELDKIILLLREHTHQDFAPYKKNTLIRRLERRKAVHLLDTTKAYTKFLEENLQEREILSKELLIGVTSFFRDPAVWTLLKEEVIPKIISEAPNNSVIRAWVVACSTGEEAYSLAITFNEVMEKTGTDKELSFQFFATDIDADAINFARTGMYKPSIKEDVSEERLKRFFSKQSQGYKIRDALREKIIFATHNLIKDPPFLNLDLLSCRNLLIYLEQHQQNKSLDLFSYCLRTDGVMVLGTSETPGAASKNFTDINGKLKIFKRTTTDLKSPVFTFSSANFKNNQMKNESKQMDDTTENLESLTDQLLLKHFSPVSTLINRDGDVLYITGSTGRYLEHATGKANLNIYAIAREGLREILPGGIRKAMKEGKPVKLTDIVIVNETQKHLVSVTIEQIQIPEALKGTVLIVFHDDKILTKKAKEETKNQYQVDLGQELRQTQEILKITREEMQASNEESKSINEELQSTNEELQSTNEELTTSKEEMQSLNEELQTVNNELQEKINDLELATSDMNNLLRTSELAILFLDKELNIRRFTDSTTNLFKLRDTDIGRPFTDIVNYLNYPELEEHSEKVLQTLLPFETSVLILKEVWLRIRIVPYRTTDDKIDGLVMTFTDITEQEELKATLNSYQENDKRS